MCFYGSEEPGAYCEVYTLTTTLIDNLALTGKLTQTIGQALDITSDR